MKITDTARRDFLLQLGGMAGAAWVQANLPAMVAAAEHAHGAAQGAKPQKFEALTAEQAREVEALAARIIPTDEMPGATEAGVVYFIDRALKTFASDALPLYENGIAGTNALTKLRFPSLSRFSEGTPEQQDEIVAEMAGDKKPTRGTLRESANLVSPDFFQLLWFHTVAGFLVDPEGGGNRNYAGWKVIGREPEHAFSPPFGFYDKDYPGWQAAMNEPEKK